MRAVHKLLCLTVASVLAVPCVCSAQKSGAFPPRMAGGAVTEAAARYSTGDIRGARAVLEAVDRKGGPDDAVKYYLGLCLAADGDFEGAEKYLLQASALDTANVWYKDALANLYFRMGDTARSSDLYLELMEEYPSRYVSEYTLTLKGDRLLGENRDSLALENYDRALLLAPDYAPALLGRSEVFRMRNNVPAFFSSLGKVVTCPGVNPAAICDYVNQILHHIDAGFYQVWGSRLDSLVASCATTFDRDSSALRLAGSWFYSTGRKERGKEYFATMLEAFPNSLDAHYIHLQMIMDGGSMKEVIDECENIVRIGGELNPEVLPAMVTIGDCYHTMGQMKQCFKAYDRVLRLDPHYLPVLNNYAYYLCLQKKKLRKAEEMSRRTVEKEPDNATYLDTYGWILFTRGDAAGAKPYFKHAMIYGGKDSAVILGHYSEVLEALGEKELAHYYRTLAESREK